MKKQTILLVSFLLVLVCGSPLPQSSDEDYGDFEGPAQPPKPDTQPLDGSAIGGLITDVIGGAVKLFGAGVEILSDVIDGSKNITEVTGDAVQLGTDATEEAVKIGIKAINNVPKILEEKVSFAQGVGKTIEETSGQVKEGLEDASTQVKVASAFAKTYGEFAVGNLLKFFDNFGKRLACNTRCESMAPGSSEREACEKENCIEIVSEDAEGREEDEYDYSYGYDDESLNEVSDNEE